jgi:hypothetical protein
MPKPQGLTAAAIDDAWGQGGRAAGENTRGRCQHVAPGLMVYQSGNHRGPIFRL